MPKYEQLPVDLTPDEVRAKGRELADTVNEYSDVEQEKKDETKRLTDRMKQLRLQIDRLERVDAKSATLKYTRRPTTRAA